MQEQQKLALLERMREDNEKSGLQFPYVQSFSGGEENVTSYDNPTGLIDANTKAIENKTNSILETQYNSIFELTTNMASSWSDDEHVVPANGLNIMTGLEGLGGTSQFLQFGKMQRNIF